MTALLKYDRIEASALWRRTSDEQRREVIVSIGEATLIISDRKDRPITHWSLAALERMNPGKQPAVYCPAGDPQETLELAQGEDNMIEAIETLRRAVEKARPHPGRVRSVGVLSSIAMVLALVLFWLPNALVNHAVSVVPQVKRTAIGDTLATRIERLSGPRCNDPAGLRSLRILQARIGGGPLSIVPGGVRTSLHLPGGRTLLNRALVEDYEEPAVIAGFVIAERTRAQATDPLRDMLEYIGIWDTFRLLTTGDVQSSALDSYAEYLLTSPRQTPSLPDLLRGFDAAQVSSAPYAYAIDVTGETVLELIEADPMTGQIGRPVMGDADWLRLQYICGG